MDYCSLLDNLDTLTINSMLFTFEWNGNDFPYDEVDEMKDIVRANNRYYMRVSRIKRKLIFAWVRSKYKYFLTLTFDNEHLHCCGKNINRYIKPTLSKFKFYCYNIDFGELNDRPHYHCICFSDEPITNEDIVWNCGFHLLKDITSKFSTAIIKYLIKFAMHSMKKSTRVTYNYKAYEDLSKINLAGGILTLGSYMYHKDLEKLRDLERI